MISRSKPIPYGIASHPYKVDSIPDLPDELRDQALQYLPAGEEITAIYVLPRSLHLKPYQQKDIKPEQALLFTKNGVLSVHESDLTGNIQAPVFIRADSLIFMQVSLILLYGRLEIIGANNGNSDRIVAEYNTVAHEKLQPAFYQFLSLAAQRIEKKINDPAMEKNAWAQANDLHMKYSNGLSLYAVSKDEQLLHIIFQPAIRQTVFLGFKRRIAFPVLFAFTGHYLIVLGEEQAKGHTDYGWIITYCPVNLIDHIESVPEKLYQRLIIHLRYEGVDGKHEVKVDAPTAEKVLEYWGDIKTRI